MGTNQMAYQSIPNRVKQLIKAPQHFSDNLTKLIVLVALCCACQLGLAFESKIEKNLPNLHSVSMTEKSETFMFYANGSCSIDDKTSLSNEMLNGYWSEISNLEGLEKHNTLVILEQIKQQIRQTRVTMQVDPNDDIKIDINWPNHQQVIELKSIDSLYLTYPDAIALSKLVSLVELLRKARNKCSETLT